MAATGPPLQAGAARADITPPTGYIMLGWARGDARITGQHTRLYAKALVLRRGPRRLALVSMDLNMVAGGMVQEAARRVRDLGFREQDVIVQATHTHAGPTGYSNFLFKDRAFPTPSAPRAQASEPDPRLYAFMVRRLALAIRRADARLRPAAAAWGHTELRGVTRNRSIEAHLADHGIERSYGSGRADEDPAGAAHTIDPNVDLLRVDAVGRTGHAPIGAWAVFANHGTVEKSTFPYYNGDHVGVAQRAVEAALRRGRNAPVLVYGNGDAGDVSAGLDRSGPAAAEGVGRREAGAMLSAWRAAGRGLTRRPAIDMRWTRVCFCGQATPFGRLAGSAVFGRSYLTGSEEGRGPLFEATEEVLEGMRLASPVEPQGRKIPAVTDPDRTLEPTGVPLSAARIGNRVMLTVPGEMTAELGRRVRASARAALSGSELKHVVVAGYANEYVSYLTTPEEYDAQHYEGGTTVYGPASGPFLTAALADLAGRLGSGAPAPPAYPFDPTRGLRPNGPGYPAGAPAGRITRQPRASPLGSAGRSSAGEEAPTASTARSTGPSSRSSASAARGWRSVDDDRGLRILWRVDDDRPQELGIPVLRPGRRGTYRAWWEAPLGASGRALPLRGHRRALSPRLAGLRRRAVASAERGGSAWRRGPPCSSRCATRRRCPSATSPPVRAARAAASSTCSWAAARAPCASTGAGASPSGGSGLRIERGAARDRVREHERARPAGAVIRNRIPTPGMTGEELRAEAAARSRAGLQRRRESILVSARPILHTAVAASLAWVVATEVLGHARPFFAPVAAVVTLGLSLGQRRRRAVEVAFGVALGILVADLLVFVIGTGTWQIAVVTALAMGTALLLGGGPLVVSQAATSAVLVTTLQPPDGGISLVALPGRAGRGSVGSRGGHPAPARGPRARGAPGGGAGARRARARRSTTWPTPWRDATRTWPRRRCSRPGPSCSPPRARRWRRPARARRSRCTGRAAGVRWSASPRSWPRSSSR